jgi:hypothetical protein
MINNINEVVLHGIIKDIQPSHTIDNITFEKAKLICRRDNGKEDVINLRFKSYSNRYKENDEIFLKGNLRSYSYKVDNNKNKVVIYVFTYFDHPEDTEEVNNVIITGRICKINELRTTRDGKYNIHFILANNIISGDGGKRLNSYIPCIAWNATAQELSKLTINTQLQLNGELHSREHKKVHENGEIELRVAHELVVNDFEVINAV